MTPLGCVAKAPFSPADNNDTFDTERRVEVISPGTLLVYSGKSRLLSWHQSGSCGITTGNQALRNGNWETNHGWKGQTGEFLFSFSKKKGSIGITWLAQGLDHPATQMVFPWDTIYMWSMRGLASHWLRPDLWHFQWSFSTTQPGLSTCNSRDCVITH